MGSSQRDKAATSLQGQIGAVNSNIKNRFNDYQIPFGYKSMKSNLDTSYDIGRKNLSSEAASEMSNAAKQTTEGLASQGVTQGSILNTAVDKAKAPIITAKYRGLSNLTSNQAGQDIGLMNTENQNKFQTTSAATNVDQANLAALFQKLGLNMNNLQNLSNSTTFDDILGGLLSAGNLAVGAGALGFSPFKKSTELNNIV